MHAVDANVLVRLIVRDDARQTAAAEEFIQRGAWISHVVLAETPWVLAAVYDVDASGIAIAVEMLLQHQSLAVQDPDVVQAAVAQYRKTPALGFPDCLIVEIARKAGHVPLGTFDRTLSRLEGVERV